MLIMSPVAGSSASSRVRPKEI